MSTIEEFENATVGATATSPDGRKTYRREARTRGGADWVHEEGDDALWAYGADLAHYRYTLGPAPAPAPTTAREALDLAWNLAHPVKEGQFVPEGTECLARFDDGYRSYETMGELITSETWTDTRTFDPLPDPEPDWLDAPAVLARLEDKTWTAVWQPCDDLWCPGAESNESRWATPHGGSGCRPWRELRDVTPLYELPSREQIADTIYDALEEAGWTSTSGHYPYEIAEAVLDLLKGQTDD